MRTRFTWIVATVALIALGALLACSSQYSASTNGLVIVPSQGGPQVGPVMETFSLDLSNGHVSQISNANGPPINGIPGPVILDPAGAYAYVITYANPAVQPSGGVTGIQSFQVGSDGKLAAGSSVVVPLQTSATTVDFPCQTVGSTVLVPASVGPAAITPVALAIDSAGKYLFLAGSTPTGQGTYVCNGITITGPVPVPGTVSVFSVSSGTLKEVMGSPFFLPYQGGGAIPSASALAVSPTVYPSQFASCSTGQTPPTSEYLFVTDFVNNALLNFTVSSAGALTPNTAGGIPTTGVETGVGPSGVAVDPCNRFAYVANATSNNVSAYKICSLVSIAQGCTAADFHLQAVGTPYAAGDAPGPITVDPYGNFVYAVDTGSNQISAYRINSTTGALTFEGNSATNVGPNSIAIRSDDSFVFVANLSPTSGNLSTYSIIPSSGGLTSLSPVQTFDNPSGVAVK